MADSPRSVPAATRADWTSTFSAYYDRTSRVAFSLALRITGNAEQSSAACEAAYLDAWNAGSSPALLEFEATLLERVRASAIRIRRDRAPEPLRSVPLGPTYEEGNALRAKLETLEPDARRAIELAYYGGIRVTEIAEVLGQSVVAVRASMRSALLELGASIQGGERTQR